MQRLRINFKTNRRHEANDTQNLKKISRNVCNLYERERKEKKVREIIKTTEGFKTKNQKINEEKITENKI